MLAVSFPKLFNNEFAMAAGAITISIIALWPILALRIKDPEPDYSEDVECSRLGQRLQHSNALADLFTNSEDIGKEKLGGSKETNFGARPATCRRVYRDPKDKAGPPEFGISTFADEGGALYWHISDRNLFLVGPRVVATFRVPSDSRITFSDLSRCHAFKER